MTPAQMDRRLDRQGWQLYSINRSPVAPFVENQKRIVSMLGSLQYEWMSVRGRHYIRRAI